MNTNTNTKPIVDREAEAFEQLAKAEQAVRMVYREYVAFLAEEIVGMIVDGEIADRDGLETYIHETADGDGWVIDTFRANALLTVSENAEAFRDTVGGVCESTVHARAYFALAADLREAIENVDLPEWMDLDEDDLGRSNREGGDDAE